MNRCRMILGVLKIVIGLHLVNGQAIVYDDPIRSPEDIPARQISDSVLGAEDDSSIQQQDLSGGVTFSTVLSDESSPVKVDDPSVEIVNPPVGVVDPPGKVVDPGVSVIDPPVEAVAQDPQTVETPAQVPQTIELENLVQDPQTVDDIVSESVAVKPVILDPQFDETILPDLSLIEDIVSDSQIIEDTPLTTSNVQIQPPPLEEIIVEESEVPDSLFDQLDSTVIDEPFANEQNVQFPVPQSIKPDITSPQLAPPDIPFRKPNSHEASYQDTNNPAIPFQQDPEVIKFELADVPDTPYQLPNTQDLSFETSDKDNDPSFQQPPYFADSPELPIVDPASVVLVDEPIIVPPISSSFSTEPIDTPIANPFPVDTPHGNPLQQGYDSIDVSHDSPDSVPHAGCTADTDCPLDTYCSSGLQQSSFLGLNLPIIGLGCRISKPSGSLCYRPRQCLSGK